MFSMLANPIGAAMKRVYRELLRKCLGPYLKGNDIDTEQLQVEFSAGKCTLTDLVFDEEKLNEKLRELRVPLQVLEASIRTMEVCLPWRNLAPTMTMGWGTGAHEGGEEGAAAPGGEQGAETTTENCYVRIEGLRIRLAACRPAAAPPSPQRHTDSAAAPEPRRAVMATPRAECYSPRHGAADAASAAEPEEELAGQESLHQVILRTLLQTELLLDDSEVSLQGAAAGAASCRATVRMGVEQLRVTDSTGSSDRLSRSVALRGLSVRLQEPAQLSGGGGAAVRQATLLKTVGGVRVDIATAASIRARPPFSPLARLFSDSNIGSSVFRWLDHAGMGVLKKTKCARE